VFAGKRFHPKGKKSLSAKEKGKKRQSTEKKTLRSEKTVGKVFFEREKGPTSSDRMKERGGGLQIPWGRLGNPKCPDKKKKELLAGIGEGPIFSGKKQNFESQNSRSNQIGKRRKAAPIFEGEGTFHWGKKVTIPERGERGGKSTLLYSADGKRGKVSVLTGKKGGRRGSPPPEKGGKERFS